MEIPYVFVQASYYTLIVYAMMSFQYTAAKFFYFFVSYFMSVVAPVPMLFAVFFAFMYSLCIKKLNFQQR